uniref:Tetratricopeptide repeat domain 4 n=1 Tax=Suricata suricatta TaxID=37032 RepID=A0A673TET3_SURSU
MEQWEKDADSDADDVMDSFLDKFQNESYSGGFREDQWEEEFEKVPLFMKKAPSEIDPNKNPDLACLQSIIFDEERSPEEQAKTYKNEGNDYFKEKEYKKAVISYSEGLKKKCTDPDLNVVLYTNRAAAQYYLGNFRSALSDVTAARKLKPCHLKAIVRGASCHLELRNFDEAMNWCDEGLQIDSRDKKLLEMRAKAHKLKARNIRVVSDGTSEDEDSDTEDLGELFMERVSAENRHGTRLSIDEQGRLSWPVLFLYPEHTQSDLITAFHEDTRLIDHLKVMFGETPSWDLEQKYCPDNIEVYFEVEGGTEIYRVPTEHTLLQVLQHPRYLVKSLVPAFMLYVRDTSVCKEYLRGKKLHQIK